MTMKTETRFFVLRNDASSFGSGKEYAAYMAGFEVAIQFTLDHPNEARELGAYMQEVNPSPNRPTVIKDMSQGLFEGPPDG